MTADEVVEQLRPLGSDAYKRVMATHGAREPVFGVKVEDLKKFQKQIKTDYRLALDLYATGVYDAMYLAGLVADDARMTKADLRRWVAGAYCPGLSEYTVPWVTAGSRHGRELAAEWIDSPKEGVASAGWATFAGLAAVTPDADLDLDELTRLLDRVQRTIPAAANRVRYVMNGFVIAVGSYVEPLSELAVRTATAIGPVRVDMHGTACKVPMAVDYIQKVRDRGAVGKKRKSVKC